MARPFAAVAQGSRRSLRRDGIRPDRVQLLPIRRGSIVNAGISFQRPVALANRLGDRNLLALVLIGRGDSTIYSKKNAEGVAWLNEAMVAVARRPLAGTGGDYLSRPIFPGRLAELEPDISRAWPRAGYKALYNMGSGQVHRLADLT